MARHDKVNLICHHKLTIAYVIWWCPVYVTQYVEFWSGWYIQLAYLSDKSKCTNMGSWAKYVWKMLSMNTRISYMMITTIIAWKLWSMHDENTMMYFILYEIFQIEGPEKWGQRCHFVLFYLKYFIKYGIHHIICIAWLVMIIDSWYDRGDHVWNSCLHG